MRRIAPAYFTALAWHALLVLLLSSGAGCLDAPPSNRALAIDAASWFPDSPKAQQQSLTQGPDEPGKKR